VRNDVRAHTEKITSNSKNNNKYQKMRIKFCPKCKSTEIEMSSGGLTGFWNCKKCGYNGTLFPEKEINKKKITK